MNRICWLLCASLMVVLLSGPAIAQQPVYENNYVMLQNNIAAQNNLKNNINLLTRLSEHAKAKAQLSRTARDRDTYNQWKSQYQELQNRIAQFQAQLHSLERQEAQYRAEIEQGRNYSQQRRIPSGGGKPMIPQNPAQNRSTQQNSGNQNAGVKAGTLNQGGSGGTYYPARDPGSVNLLDQSFKRP